MYVSRIAIWKTSIRKVYLKLELREGSYIRPALPGVTLYILTGEELVLIFLTVSRVL